MTRDTIEDHVPVHMKQKVHYAAGKQSIVAALESVYTAAEVPLNNPLFARQRALLEEDSLLWQFWFYGSPQVERTVDGEQIILFDHRVVDPNNLSKHPLLNPAHLRDHWSEIDRGAIPVPNVYADSLVDLSRTAGSAVVAVSHKSLGARDREMTLTQAAQDPYFIAFMGLSEADQALYIQSHEAKHGPKIGLGYKADAKKEAPMGCLSVFNGDDTLTRSQIGMGDARFCGVQRTLVSSSAQNTTQKKGFLERIIQSFINIPS